MSESRRSLRAPQIMRDPVDGRRMLSRRIKTLLKEAVRHLRGRLPHRGQVRKIPQRYGPRFKELLRIPRTRFVDGSKAGTLSGTRWFTFGSPIGRLG